MQIVSTPPLAAAKTPVTFDAAVGGTTGGTNQTLTLTLTVRVISAFSNTSGNTIAASSGTARVGVSTGGPGYLSIIDGTGASSVTNAGTNASYSGSLKLAA